MFVFAGGVIAAVPPLEHIMMVLLDRFASDRLPKRQLFRMTVRKKVVRRTSVTRLRQILFPRVRFTHRIITLVFHRTLFRLAPRSDRTM